jgi:hypothetical protein
MTWKAGGDLAPLRRGDLDISVKPSPPIADEARRFPASDAGFR